MVETDTKKGQETDTDSVDVVNVMLVVVIRTMEESYYLKLLHFDCKLDNCNFCTQSLHRNIIFHILLFGSKFLNNITKIGK